MLNCETNTPAMEEIILAAATKHFNSRHLIAFFEHGQWWIENRKTSAQWSVNDTETQTGVSYFSFEQVTRGDEE
jgi:hypothetical protein